MTTPPPARRLAGVGFGTVDRLPSGRFSARWGDGSGRRARGSRHCRGGHAAADLTGTAAASETLAAYGALGRVPAGFKDSTRYQFAIDSRRHLEPYLGPRLLDQIELTGGGLRKTGQRHGVRAEGSTSTGGAKSCHRTPQGFPPSSTQSPEISVVSSDTFLLD